MAVPFQQLAVGFAWRGLVSRRAWLGLALLLGLVCAGAWGAPVPVVVRDGQGQVPLAPHVALFRDPGGHLTLAEARAAYQAGRFTPNRQQWPSFGFTTDTLWVRVELDFAGPQTDDWFVLVKNTRLDHLEWYVLENGRLLRQQAMGNLDAGGKGDVNIRFPALELAAAEGKRLELYARVRSETAIHLPLVLWETNAYSARIARREFAESLVYGYLLALAVTGMVIASYAQDRGYFIYSVSVGSQMMAYLIYDGHYGWLNLPTAGYWIHNGLLLWQEAGLICALLFMRHFFNLEADYPRADRLVRGAVVVFILGLGALALGPFRLMTQLLQVQALLVGLGLLGASLFFTLKRVKIARFYLAAWLAFWLVLAVEILQWQGLLSVWFSPGQGMKLAFVLSSTFFLCAMADKIRQIKLATVAAQERSLELHRQMTLELERQVAARTRELQEAKQAAEDANVAKTRFFSHISHDLRAPLNSLVGLSQSLWLECRELALPDEFRHFLNQIQQSGSYLSQLMDNILNVALLDAGRAQARREPFPLRDWFEPLQAIVEPIALSKRIQTVWECDAAPGQIVVGDAIKLSQILLNLALNSVKFTPPGKRIRVAVRVAAGELRIEVEDDGPGIPVEARDRIFECFTQLPQNSFLPPKGVGLGLHIVKQFTDLLGGRVGVEERAGGGARFRFTMPLPTAGEAS